MAAVGAAALVAAAVLGPSAYADTQSHFTHQPSKPGKPGKGKPAKPGKPGKPDNAGDDDAHDANGHHDPSATNGGKSLPGDVGLNLADLRPTAPPATPYEMPFPCSETWSGSTRSGHSPSVRAVDFNYPGGDLGKPVVSAAAGTVVTVVVGPNKPSYGQYVVVDHGNGESSLYGHLDSVLVSLGQVVQTGTQLGTVGRTGNASGPHLHFEERVGGAVVDAWFHGSRFPMNSSQASQNCGTVAVTDIPLAGDMYGGRSAEVMVYRKSRPAAFHITRSGVKERVIKLGVGSDQPVLGDWDGDGRVNPGVRQPSTRQFVLQVKRKKTMVRFGKPGDLPIAGNWDGTGAWEIGVRRSSSAKFILRMSDGSKQKVALGDANDLPVTGDWDGNGVTDLGVYDQATATFTLLAKDPMGTPFTIAIQFGAPGDVPVTGDWDGNGLTDLGVWSPVTAIFTKRGAVAPAGATGRVKKLQFGRAAG
ncbi:M23 family metallopeptidase [Nocardioides halotolerans]|uniref:M23 family metallopeptidase n=1 Tax=Nocardioides halotolerans TaxID=433660 RepID=UPI00042A84BA|nr:M23 family metallopeptidase [Nocardioides halotolerans]